MPFCLCPRRKKIRSRPEKILVKFIIFVFYGQFLFGSSLIKRRQMISLLNKPNGMYRELIITWSSKGLVSLWLWRNIFMASLLSIIVSPDSLTPSSMILVPSRKMMNLLTITFWTKSRAPAAIKDRNWKFWDYVKLHFESRLEWLRIFSLKINESATILEH